MKFSWKWGQIILLNKFVGGTYYSLAIRKRYLLIFCYSFKFGYLETHLLEYKKELNYGRSCCGFSRFSPSFEKAKNLMQRIVIFLLAQVRFVFTDLANQVPFTITHHYYVTHKGICVKLQQQEKHYPILCLLPSQHLFLLLPSSTYLPNPLPPFYPTFK